MTVFKYTFLLNFSPGANIAFHFLVMSSIYILNKVSERLHHASLPGLLLLLPIFFPPSLMQLCYSDKPPELLVLDDNDSVSFA
jgi:hypothetical protein